MKQKQCITLFGMVAVALILAACDGDSGNNSSESEGDSSSSVEISSSSEQINLSSVVKFSSSSLLTESSSSVETCTNTYGTNTVKDCRDNQTYKTVVIGTQTWMAENLNYAVDSSWCYNNSADSCAKYGRLYQWAAAMALPAAYNEATWGGSDANHQGVCPTGWHIPTNAEWMTLGNAVGGEEVAGTALKSTSGWNDGGNGTDVYGFSALPAGYPSYHGVFSDVGTYAYFWSATEYDTDSAYTRDLNYYDEYMDSYYYYKHYAISVRCLKDF